MASFYAELAVGGQTYPTRYCSYEFTQATDTLGQVRAKVRHGLLSLTLDVPADDVLVDWAATPFKALAGKVVFYRAQGGPALETLSWEVGYCVEYREEFVSGELRTGAYVCHVRISAPQLTLQAGGAGRYVPPAAGEHTGQQQAFGGAPVVVGLLATTATAAEKVVVPVIEEFVLPTFEQIAAAGLKALGESIVVAAAGAALPVVLTAGLILGSSTPAGGPGIAQPHLLPIDPDLLRLNTLAAKHAAGTLDAVDEAELIALLAKIKGIRIKSLADLNVVGSYKKTPQPLPGFHFEEITYTKRSAADTDLLRRKFQSSVRSNFMKKISAEPAYIQELRTAGFADDDLALMQLGQVPDGWQVHHRLPLDDGGDNSFGNLLLIKNTPFHSVVTGYQKTNTGKLQPGQSKQLKWPVYNSGIVYPAKKL